MATLTHHKKSVRAMALHPKEYAPLTHGSQPHFLKASFFFLFL